MIENEWLSLGSFQPGIIGVILAHLVCNRLILWQMKSRGSTSSSFSILVPAFFRYVSNHFYISYAFGVALGEGYPEIPHKSSGIST